jgi:hypothetical protein
LINPYNDFISEGGKAWHHLKSVAEANSCVPHMLQVVNAAWKAGLRVFYALHHRYRPGDYETRKYIAPNQEAGGKGLRRREVVWRRPKSYRQHPNEPNRALSASSGGN